MRAPAYPNTEAQKGRASLASEKALLNTAADSGMNPRRASVGDKSPHVEKKTGETAKDAKPRIDSLAVRRRKSLVNQVPHPK